jgi:hypothetical protein
MTKDKYWHKLLTHFYNKNYFRNGLTLPFIIGSRTIIEPDKQIQSVTELLTEIKNSNTYLSILKCGYIGELVFSISNKTDFEIYDIDSSYTNKINFTEFCILLEKQYSELIKNSLFSRNSFGAWENYTAEKDIPRINELK